MAVFIGGIGATSNKQEFYEQISKLTKSQRKSLGEELSKEQDKVNMMEFDNVSHYNRDKARRLYRKASIEGKKRAYKKFGIDYKTSFYPKVRKK